MKFTIEEEQQIDKAAEFLVQKGYQKTYWHDQIVYGKEHVQFCMVHQEWASKYDIYIEFKTERRNIFFLSELAYVRRGIKLLENEHFEDILRLLQYIQEDYADLTDIEYCRESDKMVDKLLEDTVNKAAGFLLKKRYKKERWEDIIDYENRKIRFSVSVRYHRDGPDICICFKKENEIFSAKRSAFIRKGIKLPDKVEGIYVILELLKYIQEDYDNLKNIEYCRETRKLSIEYENKLLEEKIDKAAYFLVQKGYQKIKTEDSIVYKNGNIEFIIYTQLISNNVYKGFDGIDIRFVTENESYDMWEIADLRKQIQKSYSYSEYFEDGAKLLQYIKEDYDNLMDIEYCLDSLRMKKEADEKAEK